MAKRLTAAFFNRPTLVVAKELLGCILCRKLGGEVVRLEITEVEAYDGFEDTASHAHRGKTARNAPMWGEAGRWYVYFTYGMHWMLNIVTGPKGFPAAVLIRGGRLLPAKGRFAEPKEVSGPARLTKKLGIDRQLNGKEAASESGLWIEEGNPRIRRKIKRTPRVGVANAGPTWSEKPFRFVSV